MHVFFPTSRSSLGFTPGELLRFCLVFTWLGYPQHKEGATTGLTSDLIKWRIEAMIFSFFGFFT